MTNVPALRTERLILRMPRPSDAGPITLYASDRRVSGMTTSIPHPYLPEMAETFIEQILNGTHRADVWIMDGTPDDAGELLGLISFTPASATLGYWVGPPFWGTGYASEAVAAVSDHLFAQRGLAELNATVFFDNPASQQVLMKQGFVRGPDVWQHSVARDQEVPAMSFVRKAP